MAGQTTSALARDELVPDTVVQREFGITAMTLWRWEQDAALQFPKKIQIRKRNYRSRNELEAFKARMTAKGIAASAKTARETKSA